MDRGAEATSGTACPRGSRRPGARRPCGPTWRRPCRPGGRRTGSATRNSPTGGWRRLVHLELVVELEQLGHPLPVEDATGPAARAGRPVRGTAGRADPGRRATHRGRRRRRRAPRRRRRRAARPGHRGPSPEDADRAQPLLVADCRRLSMGPPSRRDRPATPGPTGVATVAARRPRPRRAASMNSSSRDTFRSLVHPVDLHGTAQVSGSSRITIGPSSRSGARMSSRQPSFASTQSRLILRSSSSFPPASLAGHSAIRPGTAPDSRQPHEPAQLEQLVAASASANSRTSNDDPSRSTRRDRHRRT